jgi:hypothetical protein
MALRRVEMSSGRWPGGYFCLMALIAISVFGGSGRRAHDLGRDFLGGRIARV